MLSRGLIARGFAGSVLVLLGGLVVSVVPGSSFVMRTDLLVVLRGLEPGRMIGLAVVMAGLGLLAHSWLLLCRHVTRCHGAEPERSLALTRIAAVAWSLPLMVAPPLFSRDGWSYAAQGMLAHVGVSPYRNGPGVLRGPIVEAVDPRWMFSITPYGPVPLGFGRVFASLSENPWVLVLMHRALAVLGLALLAWAVPRLARWTGVDPALASAVVLASPLMLANGVGGLHNDLLMAGLMACALVAAAERGWVWGAVLGGLAAAVKAPGGLVCLGVVLVTLPLAASLVERARRLGVVALVCVGVLLGCGLLVGTGSGWVAALSVPGRVNVPLSITTVVGGIADWVTALLPWRTHPAEFLSLVRRAGTVVALATVAFVALRWPTGRRDRSVSGVALAVGAVVVLSPVVHLWYLLWALPFVAVLRLSRLAMSLVVSLSVVLGLVAPLDSSLHDAYLAIVLGTMSVLVLVLVLLLTPGARDRVRRIAAPRWVAGVDAASGVPADSRPAAQDRPATTAPRTSPRVSVTPETDGAR